MFYYSTKTKKRVLHLKNCHHIKAIKKENVATVSSVVEAQKKGIGTTVCKCCSALRKDYSRNLNEILNFAYSNGMCCHMDEGLMRIESSFAKWIIMNFTTRTRAKVTMIIHLLDIIISISEAGPSRTFWSI